MKRFFSFSLILLPFLVGLFVFFTNETRVEAQAKKDAGKKYAVLIGVNEYTKPGYEALKFAERDMTRLKEVLEAGGFTVIMLLGSEKGDNEATAENIRRVLLDKDKSILKTVTQADTVVVALSGHGEQIPVKVDGKESESPFFCPKHAVSGDPDTQISINEVLDDLDKRGAGSNLVLVDACRKFAKPVEGKKSGASMDRAKVQSLRDGIGVMFACSDRQEAVESAKAGDGHGLFFYSVLEAIKTTKPNEQGQITWEQLVPQIRTKVSSLTETVGIAERDRQRPQYIGNFSRDPILLMAAKEADKLVAFEYVIDGEKKKGKCEVMQLDLGGGVKMEFVKIKKGKFTMGSPLQESERMNDEEQKEIEIKEDFWIGRYEVTQAQYKAIIGENPSISKGDKLPVEAVSWNDATKFCEKISEKMKKKITLPSEAQWEYACRAGTMTPFHFGKVLNGDLANCNGDFPYGTDKKGKNLGKTTDVGSYPANPWGLFDMHGNVYEWCTDWHNSDQKRKVLRGGSKTHLPWNCRSAYRYQDEPSIRSDDLGFRVICAD